ncbi:MAG: Hsp20/alpha crystallin family protein [Oculatellaceae cyanobacterium Prado106]|jgi:HSP20 family protein|nr:Hsp20/alpha crystallin family protein [Oculatellaceae cyanobacterium Prado106]
MAITQWKPFRGLERWEPFHEVENLQQEMNRLFDRWMPHGNGGSEELSFMPSAEMEETPEEIRLKLEIPGMEAKDLDIQVTEDAISISGERKSESKTEEKGMVRSEFHYGRFERAISLPVPIKNDQVKAEYQNGILHLTLPKAEEGKRKAVKVEVS